MRMRKKKNLTSRMDSCQALLIQNPAQLKGRWRSKKPDAALLRLELGCGKGRFTADTAAAHPEDLYVAIERVPDAMVIAMERACAEEIGNVRFISMDALKLREVFAPGEVERVFVNFCDPWPKSRDAKLRLTAPNFLRMYADVLGVGGEIHFKTDNTPLFDWSAEQLSAEGWELHELTHDLHANGAVGVMTDYEAKFYEAGQKINRLVARCTESTKNGKDGVVARLRNASLIDARGYASSAADNAAETERV